jgi:hypothetical protein
MPGIERPEIAEPQYPFPKKPDDQRLPLAADHIERALHRAEITGGIFHHTILTMFLVSIYDSN